MKLTQVNMITKNQLQKHATEKNKEDLQKLDKDKCEQIQWEKYKNMYIRKTTIKSVRVQF